MRKLSILALLMCKWRTTAKGNSYSEVYEKMFEKSARNTATRISKFPTHWVKVASELLSFRDLGMIRFSQTAKAALGLSTKPDINDIYTTMVNSTRSLVIKGAWLAAISKKRVKAGTLVTNSRTYDKLVDKYGKHVTVLRYPITSYQSFITLKLEIGEGITDNLVVLSSEDAPYLQLDGDDHILLSKPYSLFEGGEPVAIGRNFKKLDPADLSISELYFRGTIAQGLIGNVFNAMAAALGTNRPDLANRLAGFLDILAQAIKKPYDYDVEEELSMAEDIPNKFISPLAKICMKKDIPKALYKLWEVDIPDKMKQAELPTEVKFSRANRGYVKTVMSEFNEMLPSLEHIKPREVTSLAVALQKRLHKDIHVAFKLDDGYAISAAQTYAAIAYGIRKTADKIVDDDKRRLAETFLRIFEGDILMVGFMTAGKDIPVHRIQPRALLMESKDNTEAKISPMICLVNKAYGITNTALVSLLNTFKQLISKKEATDETN